MLRIKESKITNQIVDLETAQLLQSECLSAKHTLYYMPEVGFDYHEVRFAPYEKCFAEEERVNAITDNKVSFTFGDKDYLHFQLPDCDMLFQIKGKNAYSQVCKEVMRAQKVYSEMMELHNEMKSVLQMNYVSSIEELISMDDDTIDSIISNVCNTIKKYSLALYLLDARIYFNEILKAAFGNESYCLEVGVTENSFLYVKDNALHKKKSRSIFRGKGTDVVKYLKEGIKEYIKQICKHNINNSKIGRKMKKSSKIKAAEQEVAKQSSNENGTGNIDIAIVANYLYALLQPDTEASQLLKIAKIDLSAWLVGSTNGLVTCKVGADTITMSNTVNNVSLVLPQQALTKDILLYSLTCLMTLGQFRNEEKVSATETKVEPESAIVSLEHVETTEPDNTKDINIVFASEKSNIMHKMQSAPTLKKKRQILHGQLISICSQCGHTGLRKKKELLALLNKDNKKEYLAMYNPVA